MRKAIITALIAAVAMGAAAQDQWLHIYRSDNKITTSPVEDVLGITYSQSAQSDTLFDKMNVNIGGKLTVLDMNKVDSVVIGTNVPTMYIDIENGAEVVVKDTYLNAKISVRGWGNYDDFDQMDVTIKGRGNSTWNMQKKPYRLKFSKKQSICGMTKAKNYALLANYIDCTLMRNSIALKLGQMLGLEYTNHFIPVNLVINGTYRGSYLMTEKIGINGASVDIEDNEGILFEMDTNYDEDYRFHSDKFRLPMMVKDPDFAELAEDDPSVTASQRFQLWKDEFHKFENTLSTSGKPTADFTSQLDVNSLAKYLLVFAVTCNREPNHPKSVYMYKRRTGEPFYMGPIWDFDWAYTFGGHEDTQGYTSYLFSGSSEGTNFFKAMLRSDEVMAAYNEQWEIFYNQLWPELQKFMDEYAATIRVSAAQNGEIWYSGMYDPKYNLRSTDTFDENYKILVNWLNNRVNWLNTARNHGLFQ